MTPDYFTKKCPACDIARKKYLPKIRMNCIIKKYNVKRFKHTSKVRKWRKWANGHIPSIQLDGNGRVERYVGLEGFEELTERMESGDTTSTPIKTNKTDKELDLNPDSEVKIQGGDEYGTN